MMRPKARSRRSSTDLIISTVNLLGSYKRISDERVARQCKFIESMKPEHSQCLINHHRLLHTIRAGVSQNNFFFEAVINNMPKTFGPAMSFPTVCAVNPKIEPSPKEFEELLLLLKELRREWTAEGKVERDQFFLPLLERAEKLFPGDRKKVRVMIPGQRLGRLVFEFVKRGFWCQGQENSYLKAACGCFMLDNDIPVHSFHFHPFLHCLDNNYIDEDRTRAISLPDENPSAVLNGSMSCTFVLGHFMNAYESQRNEWDLIVTCFYVHTLPDVISFLEVVFRCLKPGAHWLNFGSLVSSSYKKRRRVLVTPSYEDIRCVISEIGFTVLEEETDIRAAFCKTQPAMRSVNYGNVLLVCQKPINFKSESEDSNFNDSREFSDDSDATLPLSDETEML